MRELRYLLSLLLMRKRKLKLIKVERGAKGEKLVLRRPRRTEELSVWVFDFTPDRIEELRARLQEALDGAGSEPSEESAPQEAASQEQPADEAEAGEQPADEEVCAEA